ncbi:hypothetical protein B0H11DRAFT_20159 [Mycena galericulata]|nr:hypothetical protein B0H11DRAFT_20159 [Mycena galericulata]
MARRAWPDSDTMNGTCVSISPPRDLTRVSVQRNSPESQSLAPAPAANCLCAPLGDRIPDAGLRVPVLLATTTTTTMKSLRMARPRPPNVHRRRLDKYRDTHPSRHCGAAQSAPATSRAPRMAQVNVNPSPRPSAAASRAGAARGRAPSRSFARALRLKDVSFARLEAVGGGVPHARRLCAMHHATASVMDDAFLPSSTARPQPTATRLASIRV